MSKTKTNSQVNRLRTRRTTREMRRMRLVFGTETATRRDYQGYRTAGSSHDRILQRQAMSHVRTRRQWNHSEDE